MVGPSGNFGALCGASLLRSLRAQVTEHDLTPRLLGVDDWTIKKGRSYGTILVDLEKHEVVDLLSDRSAAALELWLRNSPGVETIVRDKCYNYTAGAQAGAPHATQVACGAPAPQLAVNARAAACAIGIRSSRGRKRR